MSYPAGGLCGDDARDTEAHVAEVYGADVSPALVSKVAGSITAGQARPPWRVPVAG